MKSARPLKTGLIIFFIIIIVSLLFGFTYILVFSTDKKDVRVIKEDDKIVALNPFPKDYSDVKPKIKTIINEAEKEKNKSQQPLHQPIDLKPGKPNLSSERIIREPENKELIERQNALERGRIAPIVSKSFKAQGDNSSNKSLFTTSLTKPGTKFMIQAGSMLSANLITGINSDLPGYVVAKVNRDVFDSITGKYLLIPKGSKLIGKYSSSVKLLQKRVPVNWFNIKLPNGSSIDFKQGQPGTDLNGINGQPGKVNNHFVGNIMYSFSNALINSAANQINNESDGSYSDDVSQEASDDFADYSNEVIENQIIGPTIEVPIGTPIKILLIQDLTFKEPYENINY